MDYYKPKCKYADKCSSKGINCDSCKHNDGKKSYYESDRPITYPPMWIKPFPTPPWTITCIQ